MYLTALRCTVILSHMKTDLYDIKAVCAESGVTARTVHFYIQQGLLAPAGAQGPGARYNDGHLARLKLIKLLQKEHLPLAEIRRRLESLDDAKVEELVREHRSRRPPNSSAVEYIRSVLNGTHYLINTSEPAVRAAASLFAETSPQSSIRNSPSRVSERSQWERIVLSPDIELHIRRPLSRIQNRIIGAFMQQARETLKEES